MSASAAMAQVNVRMQRDLKERGDATLALVGSSPAVIIRQLWQALAEGGEAYQRIMRALVKADVAEEAAVAGTSLLQASTLFEGLGTALGLDLASFVPDTRPTSEVLEDIEWELLEERGLA